MAPVKVVALLQMMERGCLQARMGIEQPVADVDRPRHQCQQEGRPRRQADMCGPGKPMTPDHGHRRSVEAGQVPKSQGRWRAPRAVRATVGVGCSALGGRIGQNLLHCSDCRRSLGRRRLARAGDSGETLFNQRLDFGVDV